jgi:hypothetical protein
MPEAPDKRYFSRISGQNGFKADSLEKVYRLLTVLARMNGIPELQEKLALKGAPAIHRSRMEGWYLGTHLSAGRANGYHNEVINHFCRLTRMRSFRNGWAS